LTGHAPYGQHQTRLCPADHYRPPTDRQIPHPARPAILGPRHRPTLRAAHQISGGLHE
jgi:hypothetical protein